AHILSAKYRVGKTEANLNTDIGIAISVLKNLKPATQFFVAEIGAYKKREIAKACKIIKPKFAIVTAIGNQHLDLFGSKKNLILAKKELLDVLPKEGRAYVYSDFNKFNEMIKGIRAPVVSLNPPRDRNRVRYDGIDFNIETTLLGDYVARNLLPCIALAHDLGLTKREIEKAIANLAQVPDTLSRHKGLDGSTVIKDSINTSVEGFIAAIKTADSMGKKQKIIASKGVIELGDEKKESYQKILSTLYKSKLLLYTTDKLFKTMDKRSRVYLFKDEEEILEKLKKETNRETVVVIEGKFTTKFIQSLIQN
ncbi:hypothetical protein HYT33_04675, partial [Candidatus Roizmanbacteria bacterium]|nr:hypothetical protein [Candidatus Roizmanbacteria bacterium]